MPTLRQAAEDKSWRVRYMVADKFTEVCIIIYALLTVQKESMSDMLGEHYVNIFTGEKMAIVKTRFFLIPFSNPNFILTCIHFLF